MDDPSTMERFQLPHREHLDEAHKDCVYTFQSAARYLVSGSRDRTIRIWNTDTQRLIRPPLVGHEGSVLDVQFDTRPEQDVIISGGTDSTIIIWRFSTGEILRKIAGEHKESILTLHFDDRFLVTGSKDKTVKLWNRQTLAADDESLPRFIRDKDNEGLMITEYSCLATFTKHAAAINAAKIHKDLLVSGSGDRTIHIWDLQSGEIKHQLNLHNMGIACLQFNGRFLVSGSSDKTAVIYDIEKDKMIARLEGHHSNLIRSIHTDFDKEGMPVRVITGSYDNTVAVWVKDLPSQKWTVVKEYSYGQLQHESFSARVFRVSVDSGRLICAGQGSVIEGWNVE